MRPTLLDLAAPWALWVAIGIVSLVSLLILVRTSGAAFGRLGAAARAAFASGGQGEGDLSPRDAFFVTASMSALPLVCGTATAIAVGGPGAVFWLVVAGLVLSAYRFVDAGLARAHGGPTEETRGAAGAVASALSRRWPSASFVYAFLGLGAAGFAGAALAGRSVAEAARAAGWPGAYFAMALGVVGLGIAFVGPARAAAVARVAAPVALSAIAIASIAAMIAHPDRVPRAVGRIFSEALSGAAPSGAFIGAFVVEAIRGGLGLGLAATAAPFGAAATVQSDARHDDPGKAALAASFEPLLSIVLVAFFVGVPILTSRAWNHPGPTEYSLGEAVALTATAASAAEATDPERRFNRVTRWRHGKTLDIIYFLGGRGMLEDVRMIDGRRRANVALFFEEGRIERIQVPDFHGRGRNPRLLDVPITRANRIVLRGNGLRRGAVLGAAALEDGLPKGLGAPVLALATILLALSALAGWTHYAARISPLLADSSVARAMTLMVGAAAALGAVRHAPWLVPAGAALVALLAIVHGLALLLGSREASDLTDRSGGR